MVDADPLYCVQRALRAEKEATAVGPRSSSLARTANAPHSAVSLARSSFHAYTSNLVRLSRLRKQAVYLEVCKGQGQRTPVHMPERQSTATTQ